MKRQFVASKRALSYVFTPEMGEIRTDSLATEVLGKMPGANRHHLPGYVWPMTHRFLIEKNGSGCKVDGERGGLEFAFC